MNREQAAFESTGATIAFTTGGSRAQSGSGEWTLPLSVTSAMIGQTWRCSCEVFDASAPGGSVRTNELLLTFAP